MNGFRARLRYAIEQSSYAGNYRRLSLDAQLGEKRVSNLLNDKTIEESPIGPGLFAMARIADLLDVSLDYLSCRHSRFSRASETSTQNELETILRRTRDAAKGQISDSSAPPTPQSLMRLFAKSGGRIEAFKSSLPYCDLYNAITDDAEVVSVKSVGSQSLAAITMGTSNADILQGALNNAEDKSLKTRLVQDHLEALNRGVLCTVESLNIQMPNRPVLVKMDYIRILLALDDADRNRTIVSHASLIV